MSLYAVRELVWAEQAAKGPYRRIPREVVASDFAPADYAVAEAEATRRDHDVWLGPAFNPFRYGLSLFERSSLPADVLRDWLLDRGLEPPRVGTAWDDWYAATRPDPLLMREGLDKLRFFEAAAAGVPAFVVCRRLQARYQFYDWPDRSEMVGKPRQAFATQAAAEAWVRAEDRGDYHVSQVYHTVPVPYFGPPASPGNPLCVVRRLAIDSSGMAAGVGDKPFAWVTLAAFADKADAERHRDAPSRQLRRTLNPFALLGSLAMHGLTSDDLHATGIPFAYRDPLKYFGTEAAWFDAEQEGLTDGDREAVWGLLGRVPFYDVAETRWG